jgi:hypothetical protein
MLLFSFSPCCSPFRIAAFLFTLLLSFSRYVLLFALLFSSSPYYSFLPATILLFALLLSSLPYYSPLHIINLFFGFPLCTIALLFKCSSISSTRFFMLPLLVCCYSLRNFVLPPCIPSYKN